MTAQSKYDNYDDTQLAKGIKLSLKLSDGAGKAQAIEAGLMLAEARKRYPADVDFEKFLVSVDGVGLSRARDLIGFAEGRKDWDKHQADNRAAGERHRAKVKADKQEAVQLANRLKAKVEKAETAALAKPFPPPPFVSETTLIKAAPLANGANPDPKTPKLTAATMKAALPVPGRVGKDQVTHPRNCHDDLANATCGCLRTLANFSVTIWIPDGSMKVNQKISAASER